MAEIVDFDELVAPPKRVKIDGTWYKLPGDMPLELMLSIETAEGATGPGAVAGLRDQILKLFQIHQPKLQKLPGSLTDLITLIPYVYGGEDEKKAVKQMRGRTGSARSSRKPAAKRTRSRSQTS